MRIAIREELPPSAASPTRLGAGSPGAGFEEHSRRPTCEDGAHIKDMSWALFVSPCDFRTHSM